MNEGRVKEIASKYFYGFGGAARCEDCISAINEALEEECATLRSRIEHAEADFIVVHKNCIAARVRCEAAERCIDKLLTHCPDAECMECGKIVCPHGEPLHFHHDGCPACA